MTINITCNVHVEKLVITNFAYLPEDVSISKSVCALETFSFSIVTISPWESEQHLKLGLPCVQKRTVLG